MLTSKNKGPCAGRRLLCFNRFLLFYAPALLVITLVTLLLASSSWQSDLKVLEARKYERASLQAQLLTASISSLLTDVAVFAEFPELEEGLVQPSSLSDGELRRELLAFCRANRTYTRIRLMDSHGRLAMGVSRHDSTFKFTSGNKGEATPEEYQRVARTLKRGDVYVLARQDSVAHHIGDTTTHLTLRVVAGVYDQQEKQTGFVVVDDDIGQLFHQLIHEHPARLGGQFLVDAHGEWLITPENGDESGGAALDQSFPKALPEAWKKLSFWGVTQFRTSEGLFTAANIPINVRRGKESWVSDGNIHVSNGIKWLLVHYVPSRQLADMMWRAIRLEVGAGLVLAIFVAFMTRTLVVGWAERRQSREHLNDLNRTLTSIIESSPLAILVLDRRGRVLHWNHAAEHMFGWRADEVLGQVNPAIPGDKQAEFRQLIEQSIDADEPIELEVLRQDRYGNPLELYLWATGLAKIDGRATAVLGVFADVSVRNRAIRAEAHAAQMETAHKMARTVAHEFRQPLAALAMIADIYDIKQGGDGDLKSILGRIPGLVHRMDSLVERLLHLTDIKDRTYWRDIDIIDLEESSSGSDSADHPLPGGPQEEEGEGA